MTPPGRRAITAILLLIANFKIIRRGRRPRRPGRCAYIAGGYRIRPYGGLKPPLCKGRWHGVSRDGGIGACMGVLGCSRKTTIPQSAWRLTPLTRPGPSVAARHLPTLWGVTLYTREPLTPPLSLFWPRGHFDLHFRVSRGRTPWAGPPIEIKRPSNLSHYPLDPTGHICYYFNMRGFVPSHIL